MATVPYLRGLVDCYSAAIIDTTAQHSNLYQYSVIYKFINDTCSDFTVKVADNFGAGGSGHGDHTSPTPAGENAWCVWRYPYQYSEYRTVDLYVLIQWADTDTFGAAPGDPGEITGSTNNGVGMQLAWMLDGSSPWQGTTDADGADTKGTPVWHPDAMVLPAPNTRAGEFNTNREYCAGFIDTVSATYNAHYGMVGNPDFFVWYTDTRATKLYCRSKIWSCVDVLTPLSGTVSASCPIVMSFPGIMANSSTAAGAWNTGSGFAADTTTFIGENFNTTAYSSQTRDGGSFTCVPGVNGTSCFKFSTYGVSTVNEVASNSNNAGTYDIYPIYVYNVSDANGGLGTLPHIYCASTTCGVYAIFDGSLWDAPVTQCQISLQQGEGQAGFVVPWIGDAPTANLSRSGRSFT